MNLPRMLLVDSFVSLNFLLHRTVLVREEYVVVSSLFDLTLMDQTENVMSNRLVFQVLKSEREKEKELLFFLHSIG